MSHAVDFYRRQMDYWLAQSHAASQSGDYAAWQFAQCEAANYRAMLDGVSGSLNAEGDDDGHH